MLFLSHLRNMCPVVIGLPETMPFRKTKKRAKYLYDSSVQIKFKCLFLLFLQHSITMLTCNVLCSYRPHSWREDLYSNKAIKYTTFNHTLKHCFIYIYKYKIVLEQLTIKQGTPYSFLYNSVF